jgi:acyl-CoA dehydrogenase
MNSAPLTADTSVEWKDSPFTDEEQLFATTMRSFFDKELDSKIAYYEKGGDIREMWTKAAEAGVLGACIPEKFGGPGASEIFNVIMSYELGRSVGFGSLGACISTDLASMIVMEGGTTAQKSALAPRILSGAIQALALTEADAGSDPSSMRSSAVRDGDSYVLNGSKTYISNGHIADLLYIVAKTDPSAGFRGLTMFIVEGTNPALSRRKMKTMSWPGAGVGELHFTDLRVPVSNVLGGEGKAVRLLSSSLAVDRLQTAGRALAQAELALGMTTDYAKQRRISGELLIDYQNTRMKLATMKMEIEVGRSVFYDGVRKLRAHRYQVVDAAIGKVWVTEMSARVLDGCVQIYGGAGFMDEMPISRLYTSNRQFRIVAGTTELLLLQIAKSL